MGLSNIDLDRIKTLFREEIRPIVREEVQALVPGIVAVEISKQMSPTPGGMLALENDIKELYRSVSQMQKEMNNGFKSLRLNIAFLAKQIGVRLPKTS
jgi:hypothetical protein